MSVKTPGQLAEAINVLHTQAMDEFPEAIRDPYLRLLEEVMERMVELQGQHPMPERLSLRERLAAARKKRLAR